MRLRRPLAALVATAALVTAGGTLTACGSADDTVQDQQEDQDDDEGDDAGDDEDEDDD